MFDLTGKTALVTGAASGIGEAAAIALAESGAVVYVADIDAENGERVVNAISSHGGEAAFVPLDVSEPRQCQAAADAVQERSGKLDVLVNNAGIGHVGTILETTSEDLERLFRVNVRGMFDLTKAVLPGMIESGGGVIINLASIGGIVAIKDRLAYCTTKFAVVGFTKCLALDHALQGIRANALCPGRVETSFVKKMIAAYPEPQIAYAEMASTQALGRMGTPEEIGACIVYLSSDEAAFITGTALEIDGGFSVGK